MVSTFPFGGGDQTWTQSWAIARINFSTCLWFAYDYDIKFKHVISKYFVWCLILNFTKTINKCDVRCCECFLYLFKLWGVKACYWKVSQTLNRAVINFFHFNATLRMTFLIQQNPVNFSLHTKVIFLLLAAISGSLPKKESCHSNSKSSLEAVSFVQNQ